MKRSLLLLLLATTSAMSSLNAADPRATQLTYEPWTKVCIGGDLRFVGTGARGKCVPSGGSFAVHIPKGGQRSLFVQFGTTRGLEGDISVETDRDDRITISPGPCYASGCTGKFDIDNQFVERLRRAQKITIEATDSAHQKHSLSFSLADFARAFDGPGTEPKVVEEIIGSEQWKESIRRAERERLPKCDD